MTPYEALEPRASSPVFDLDIGSFFEPYGPPVELRTDVPHSARMYDYFLLRHEALTTGWG